MILGDVAPDDVDDAYAKHVATVILAYIVATAAVAGLLYVYISHTK